MFIFRQVAEKMKKKKMSDTQTVPSTPNMYAEGKGNKAKSEDLQASFAVLDSDLANTSSSEVNIITNNLKILVWNYLLLNF